MTIDTAAPAPRTYLFVPGDRPERFDKALASAADAVVLDLEDAVLPADKPRARAAVAQALAAMAPEARARCVLRINDEATPHHAEDVALLRASGIAQAMLPKAERADTLVQLRAACPRLAVLALIETARGVLRAESIAEAPGVSRLVFGTIDFALDLHLSGDAIGFDHAAACLALASRAAGLPGPVAGVTPAIHDGALLLADLQRARAHGFTAKLCIHPAQVQPIHDALRPSAAELDWAARVVAAMQTATGAVQLDGRMLDKPVLQRAQALLARAAR